MKILKFVFYYIAVTTTLYISILLNLPIILPIGSIIITSLLAYYQPKLAGLLMIAEVILIAILYPNELFPWRIGFSGPVYMLLVSGIMFSSQFRYEGSAGKNHEKI